jgi:hypothetical protein
VNTIKYLFASACVLLILTSSSGKNEESTPSGSSLLWEQDLTALGCPAPQVLSKFLSTRLAVFTGDGRIVAVTVGPPQTVNQGQLVTPACLLSFDAMTGKLIAKKTLTESRVLLFPTATDRVILVTKQAVVLNSDLSETGINFDFPSGRIQHISPDGTTLAWERRAKDEPGMRMLDTNTLKPTGVDLSERTPSTVTPKAAATTNAIWNQRDEAHRRGSITTQQGSIPLTLTNCKGAFTINFLTDDKMLITCSDSFRVQDLQGRIISEHTFPGKEVNYGGVARNGTRFVVVVEKRSKSDPWPISQEEHLLYDVEGKVVVATIPVSKGSDGTWTAVSTNGELILFGSPEGLFVYRVH